jgi:hypothetical protein
MPAYFYDPYRLRVHKMSGGTFQNFADKSYLKLTDEQNATLGNQKIQQDTEALADFLEKDRARIHEKYSRLWKFW